MNCHAPTVGQYYCNDCTVAYKATKQQQPNTKKRDQSVDMEEEE